MAELTAKSAAAGLLPQRFGALRLSEAPEAVLTGISPHAGEVAQCSAALRAAHGIALPPPNRLESGDDGAMAIWFGRNRWLLVGPAPDADLAGAAALADQTDAWVSVLIEGPGAADVLARLVPVDLRDAAFPVGAVARTELQHMQAAIARTGPRTFLAMTFRSMAGTLVHDLVTAARSVAARATV